MYGEKVEENEELKLDLEDVKQMYKQQVRSLQMIYSLTESCAVWSIFQFNTVY